MDICNLLSAEGRAQAEKLMANRAHVIALAYGQRAKKKTRRFHRRLIERIDARLAELAEREDLPRDYFKMT